LARVGAIFSLSCGTILDLAVGGYLGKGQGEVTLFRQLWGLFRPGDVVLADALICNYRSLCSLNQRGVDVVKRMVYLTDRAFEITKRLLVKDPEGNLFRNAYRDPWTPSPVQCAVDRTRIRIGKRETKRLGRIVGPQTLSLRAAPFVRNACFGAGSGFDHCRRVDGAQRSINAGKGVVVKAACFDSTAQKRVARAAQTMAPPNPPSALPSTPPH
jgi:hypothetical protein